MQPFQENFLSVCFPPEVIYISECLKLKLQRYLSLFTLAKTYYLGLNVGI